MSREGRVRLLVKRKTGHVLYLVKIFIEVKDTLNKKTMEKSNGNFSHEGVGVTYSHRKTVELGIINFPH